MKKLAIKGHPTRGKEVIEILEMLGGVNKFDHEGSTEYWYVLEGRVIQYREILFKGKGFTLEEFLEKFPYKVGDKVKNARINDCIGRITNVRWDDNEEQIIYVIEWDDMIKRILPYFARDLQPYKEKAMKEIKIDIPKGYEFAGVDDDKQQIVFTKIQLKYPKTYKECCEVLGCKADDFFTNFGYNGCDVEISEYEDKVDDLLQNFRKLRYCRDAYWKIEGEQMGLGKPWEPDLENEELYCIQNYNNQIVKSKTNTAFNKILIFPTEEMRDIFLENFKELIELCKKLL